MKTINIFCLASYRTTLLLVIALLQIGCKDVVKTPESALAQYGKPNVILILTDDQGYGDISALGNPILQTPNIDSLHSESVRFTQFHVSPMCTPTRGELMTGQSAFKNGAVHVTQGRSMPRREIPIMPEVFRRNGYTTGHFGKWHLGDNAPYRPQDRGFDETLSHGAWGVGSLGDYHGNNYFDDYYNHNGTWKPYQGYCTDVWFGEAIKWMEKQRLANTPFFTYIATNTPHVPDIVEARYTEKYHAPLAEFDFDALPEEMIQWVKEKHPNWQQVIDNYLAMRPKGLANFFGMIANLDENLGELDTYLESSGLKENTLVIFMTDNGSAGGEAIYNAGMRGHKMSYYDGGHRVPFFFRWPAAGYDTPRDIAALTHSTDLLPTLIDILDLQAMPSMDLDGASLAPLLKDPEAKMPNRKIMIMFWRLNEEGGAVLWGDWRLVNSDELYNIATDPSQQNNIADQHPDILNAMQKYRAEQVSYLTPLTKTVNYIDIGVPSEPETFLSAANWVGGSTDTWSHLADNHFGYWNINVLQSGKYTITMSRYPGEENTPIRSDFDQVEQALSLPAVRNVTSKSTVSGGVKIEGILASQAVLTLGERVLTDTVSDDTASVTFTVQLNKGDRFKLEGLFKDENGKQLAGAAYVYINRSSLSNNRGKPN